MRRIAISSLLLALLAVPAVLPADDCASGARPAATLLFPYFEVDLNGSSGGRSTVLAVGNASSSEPALAHFVVWTDRGLPTLAFDVVIAPDAVKTISLRDVFLFGLVPTSPSGGFDGCLGATNPPPLDEAARLVLQAQHTGQPVGEDERCWGSGAGGALALGFVTVDSASICSASVKFPSQKGYFVPGGGGVANDLNVLYGDYFLIDDAGNFAQGDAAVHLVADASRFGDGLLPTFWSSGLPTRADHRAPLPTRHRTRYLNGGLFDGGTDLLTFLTYPGWAAAEAPLCGEFFGYECHELLVSPFDEAGQADVPYLRFDADFGGPVSMRLHVGDAVLPVSAPFGLLDLENYDAAGCVIVPPPPIPIQQHVTTIHSAFGRLSVGLGATATRSACDPPPL